MDEERWQSLVRKLEPQAREDPGRYRRKVLLLAGLGYAYIAFLLCLFVGLAVLVVVLALKGHAVLLLKLLIPIGALVWVVVRSLWVRFEPPEGVPLRRDDAPDLFRMIGDVNEAIQGPRLHAVLLGGDANAGVVQVPRAGGLLGSRSYLVLGLPYLQALSVDQFRAVLAHELGHLSRRHGRFGAFVYRVRATWFRLLQGFEERKSIWTGLVRRFFEWYVPYFNAYTLPLARQQELEADEASVHAASREAAASSLVAANLAARWLDEDYWPRVFRGAVEEPSPPRSAFAPLARELGEAKRFGNVEAWYRDLLATDTDPGDSHPSVAERLQYLGVDPEEALRAATTDAAPVAAQALLGEAEPRLVEAVGRAWSADVEAGWRAEHAEAQKAKADLRRLEEQDSLPPEEALKRAQLTETFSGPHAALARYRELVDTESDAPARYAIGRLLLEQDDEEGLRWLDEAIERDPDAVLPACEIAYRFLRERGREEEAARYRERAERQVEVLDAAAEERWGVSVDDELEPPDLPEEVLERIRRKVAWHEDVREAYLVRKRAAHLDDAHPFYVLALVPKGGFRAAWREADDDYEPLEERVARDLGFTEEEFMIARMDWRSPIARRLAEIEGAKIFRRDS
ncbi:MAG TPA: M48 family metallopeptidase [Gaiellaceae bacterium]|nr:M48 family metallopeptidase [Gaiellaceae bacterium]